MIGLADFEGRWSLTRRIDDRRAGQEATFDGTAVFAPDGTGLTLTETGWLQPATGPRLQGSRRYLWREGIEVFFEDGRPFHRFTPAAPAALHDCPPDTYRVTYDFTRWPRWTATWEVTGPRKDYTMVSAYAPTSSVMTFEDRSSVR
ncbi:DUF6314 family protein [Pseudaestuariivita atlantica]|uniref:DUF6314 domain-containing protein n=1 Tax=Pseudaestuariivita atlantica TaxID=1317121 RepID=A0A0L1JUC3_9RHOB|nr:DUF6314 family protein [Pseudaestuariivita atlantica]KNG95384.1 hypothetical protein ATO11_01870 [Pseudaestuariivita atlantica]